MMKFIFIICCIRNSDNEKLLYLIIGAVISLCISLILFRLNSNKEKNQIISNLKSEIIGICIKLTRYYIQLEKCLLLKESSQQAWSIFVNEDYSKILKEITFKYLDRADDIGLQFELLRPDLDKLISNLSDYIPNKEAVYLKAKLVEFNKIPYRTFTDCYKNIKDKKELDLKLKTDLESSQDFIEEKGFGKPLNEIIERIEHLDSKS